jgi:hypothetical protein
MGHDSATSHGKHDSPHSDGSRIAQTAVDETAEKERGYVMSTILIIVLLVLLLGGGGAYYGPRAGWGGSHYGGGLLGLVLIVLLILWLTGSIGGGVRIR